MADVTDMAFRQIITSCAKPDVLFTEFVSADGLCSSRFLPNQNDLAEKSRILDFIIAERIKSGEKGRLKLLKHLAFKENERPIVAQFFGATPENFYKCAQLAVELGFDGIDINMGCPAGKIVKNDSGAGLILNPKLAKEIIRETKRGADGLPVSVKTRIGYNKIITEEWVSHLIEAEPAAIIIHGRTQKEMSKVPVHWDEIGKAAILCHQAGIPVIGNGDITTYQEGLEKAEQYKLDGIMVGRGIFSNPWFLDPSIVPATKTPKERMELLKKHISLFMELWGNNKSFGVMKRFFKVYISNWEDAKELRAELMKTKTASEAHDVINGWIM